MANFLYIDNSNIWIEGMHVSAVAKGMAPNIWTACENRICDFDWKLDFGKLYEFVGGTPEGRAVLYGSRPPANDSLWAIARSQGFEVVVHDRNVQNKEKKIDTEITADMIDDSWAKMKAGQDEVTLVAGDKDYVPAVDRLIKNGFKVDVCFWEHAATELKNACTRFISLDPHLEHLRLTHCPTRLRDEDTTDP